MYIQPLLPLVVFVLEILPWNGTCLFQEALCHLRLQSGYYANCTSHEFILFLRGLPAHKSESAPGQRSKLACYTCCRCIPKGRTYCPFCSTPVRKPPLLDRGRETSTERKKKLWKVVHINSGGSTYKRPNLVQEFVEILRLALQFAHTALFSERFRRLFAPKAAQITFISAHTKKLVCLVVRLMFHNALQERHLLCIH